MKITKRKTKKNEIKNGTKDLIPISNYNHEE